MTRPNSILNIPPPLKLNSPTIIHTRNCRPSIIGPNRDVNGSIFSGSHTVPLRLKLTIFGSIGKAACRFRANTTMTKITAILSTACRTTWCINIEIDTQAEAWHTWLRKKQFLIFLSLSLSLSLSFLSTWCINIKIDTQAEAWHTWLHKKQCLIFNRFLKFSAFTI